MSVMSKLVIPSDPERLEDVDAFAEERIAKLHFTPDQRDDIAISLSEAVNNAILHGNQGDIKKTVTIVLEERDTDLRIEVSDQGDGFEPEEVADPTDPENLLAESGRGLLIIRHLMDDVIVTPTEHGTVVELIKRFSNNK